MRLVVLMCLALASCGEPTGEPLVSAQFPPGTGAVNDASEPQPIESLPYGAGNYSPGPGGLQPSFFNRTFRTP